MPALNDKHIDVTQSLKDTENSLRDFIALMLQKQLGDSWVEKCGVSTERLDKWKERRVAEEKRQKSGVVEQRLIYYADFYDLRHLLILGRVTSGKGGPLILAGANEVLKAEFPELAENINIQLPDEKSRRVGQSIAAASLPTTIN